MNTAQCKAFICDPQTPISFPDFREVMGTAWGAAGYIPNLDRPSSWKRISKKKIVPQEIENYEDLPGDFVDYVMTKDIKECRCTAIVDPAYFSTNLSFIHRVFVVNTGDSVSVDIFTDAIDDKVVAFSWNVD